MKNILMLLLLFSLCTYSQTETKKIQIEPGVKTSQLTLSNDGSAIAFKFQKDGKDFLQINEKKVGPFEFINLSSISPDGLRYTIQYREAGAKYFRVDEKVFGPFQNIGRVFFSSASKSYGVVYFKNKDEKYVQVNEKIFGPFDGSS